jgi:hypothetical protein
MWIEGVEIIEGYGKITPDIYGLISILGGYIVNHNLGQVFYGITDDVEVVRRFISDLREKLLPGSMLSLHSTHEPSSLLNTTSVTFAVPNLEVHRIIFYGTAENSPVVQQLVHPVEI